MNNFCLLRTGHGYEQGSMGRCQAFDNITLISNPLSDFRSRGHGGRVFDHPNGTKTDYSSFAFWLGQFPNDTTRFLLLTQNGSGREVWSIPQFYGDIDIRTIFDSMTEREQYVLLFTMWRLASNSREQAVAEVTQKWSKAFTEGRIKKRKRAGRSYLEIIPPNGEDPVDQINIINP